MTLNIYMSKDVPKTTEAIYLDISSKSNLIKINDANTYSVYCAPKFWALYYALNESFSNEIANGVIVELTHDSLATLIYAATTNYDPNDSFSTVPTLCMLLKIFNDMEECGYHFWFCCKW